jgi:type I restriction enzyme S subunit
MNAQMLLENFGPIANAPGGVKRLRELILQLGVQGKLVEQRPDDIPALDCIEQADDPIMDIVLHSSIPVPKGWISIPLGCVIASNIGGGTPSKNNPTYWNGDISWASVKDIQHYKFIESTIDKITEEGLQKSSSNLIPSHHLIVVTRMGLGKIAINKIPIAINQDLRAIKPTQAFDLDYAYLLFKSLNFVGKGVTVKGITVKELHAQSILLPPIEEQRRIVAKVDELMALCDKLEAQQQERERRFPVLSRACHARFVEAPTMANLKAIFDEVESVSTEDLRKTILTIAVQGKLVSQNLDDDPVDELLNEISDQRELLVKTKVIPKPKELSNSEPEPFEIPESWKWIQLGNVATLIEYGTSYKADSNSKNIPVYRMGNIQNGNLISNNLKYVPPEIDGLPRLYLELGDILFNRTNSWELVGKSGIYKGTTQSHTFASYLIRVRLPTNKLEAEFFNLCFLAPYFRITQIEPGLTQQCGQANFNGTKLANSLFPLPPLNEQRRIVAKVNQLMALIDKLEEQQTRKAKVAQAFAQAAVSAITGAEINQ